MLFGTTMQGGPCNYCGTVFRWGPKAGNDGLSNRRTDGFQQVVVADRFA
jgi:uncharacterized repeat protein (TIGR03803 family)